MQMALAGFGGVLLVRRNAPVLIQVILKFVFLACDATMICCTTRPGPRPPRLIPLTFSEQHNMELPRRSLGNELLDPGAMTALRYRLRRRATQHDLVTVVVCAFDHRTRMLPFIFTDTRMADRKSTRLNSSHTDISRMPSSA